MEGMARYGTAAVTELPGSACIWSVTQSIIVGCLLSLVGVLYPAIVAARMQPVEAMRVEH